MSLLVIGIPIMRAMHHHDHEESGFVSHRYYSGDSQGLADLKQCGFCEFFTHFAPKDTDPVVSFTFGTPMTPVSASCGDLVCKRPSKGLLWGYSNRGPPIPISIH